MASGGNSKYASLDFYVPENLTQIFINGFDEVGLHASSPRCFSASPKNLKGFFSVIFERVKPYAPLILKVLDMLQRKHSIKIEIAADRKVFDLKGVSTEDALKLIEAASSIRVSQSSDAEVSNSASTTAKSTK